MALNFPDSPTLNQTYSAGGKTWTYNGSRWVLLTASADISVADGSVSTAKVADGAITAAKIADGTIVAAEIANSAITTAKINNNAVTQAKLASNVSGITLTTTANRSTDIPSPFTAQFIFLTDTNTLQRWSGSAWTNVLASPPGAPTALSATLLSTTSVSVAFTPGASAGATTTNYKYALSTNGGAAYGEPTAVDPADFTSPITISGLTNGTTYHIKLKAVTDVGDSEFSSATSITIPALTVDYLVVAGGGGGGAGYYAGGGGAGGLRSTVTATGGGGSLESALVSTLNTNYAVVIGNGGSGSTNVNAAGSNGSNSVFSTITSVGGGGALSRDQDTTGATGGSGGGVALYGTPGSGTANQGFAGGTGVYGGSGGGAGAAGADGANYTNSLGGLYGATGGIGVATTISGSSVYYAGGGGGGSIQNTANAVFPGGLGGGGAGGYSSVVLASSGTVNTGGGGGGAGGPQDGVYSYGGNGGRGVVILRYPSVYTITLGAGLTGSTTTVSSDKVTTITAGSGNVSWA